MKIKNFKVKNFEAPYIIAEIGSNHNGDIKLAKRLIEEAKRVGCDCVKFQSWSADSIFSKKVYEDNFFLNDDYRDRSDFTLRKIVEEYSFGDASLLEARNYCNEVGIDFTSTPFSNNEVDFLVEELSAPFIKVASMDLNNYPFLKYIASKNRPVMLSTGLSTLSEIDKAIEVIECAGNKEIMLLHCVSVYPPRDIEVNLNNIEMLRHNYPNYPVGFSDHSIGFEIPLAAIAKGACILEKHFTLDKSMVGWDHKVSATPDEMKIIVNGGKRINEALGSYRRIVSEAEKLKIPAFRRSIVSKRKIIAGQLITADDLDFKRPGTGIPPEYLKLIVGRPARRDIDIDELITDRDF